jgi:hypothetical protein
MWPNPKGSGSERQTRSEPQNKPENVASGGKYAYANIANLPSGSGNLLPEFPLLIFDPTILYT